MQRSIVFVSLALSFVVLASCVSRDAADVAKPEAAPSAAPTPAPAPPAPVALASLALRVPSDCKSRADTVSISVKDGLLSEVLLLFSDMAGLPIQCPTCPPKQTVTGELTDAPWDCVLADLAAQMHFEVAVGPEAIVLGAPTSGAK